MGYQWIDGGVCAASGFKAGGVHCGIRRNRTKKDLALIYSDRLCNAAAIHTANKVKGAPNVLTEQNLQDGKAQAVLCNSGNANTCNADGLEIAEKMCKSISGVLGISSQNVVIASTGVIGQPLPIETILGASQTLVDSLAEDGSGLASEAIMTTDTMTKECAVQFELGEKTCKLGGIAKGSGMIHPNMATMLCFITTDADISPELLKKAIKEAADESFHMMSVDGDTSTNDMVAILANGMAENAPVDQEGYNVFLEALTAVCKDLARKIAQDGEGATKLLECVVTGAPDKKAARAVAKSVVCSSLLKAAMFAADANWGRVLCAIGYADAEFDITAVGVKFRSAAGEVTVCENGAGVLFSEEEAKKVLLEKEIRILVTMAQGNGEATAYGCDLTYDYVKINADYRS